MAMANIPQPQLAISLEGKGMNQQFAYRLKLAEGFLQEAYQDVSLERWRAAVDNAQLTVENAAKSILALSGPVGRTHNPGPWLRQIVESKRFPQLPTNPIMRLAELAELLGTDIHMQTDYGDEGQTLTPWELFNEPEAKQAVALAEEAMAIVESLVLQLQASDGA